MIARLDRVARVVSRYAAIGGGVLILLAALLVFFDILARKLIGWTVGGADELSGYALAIGTAWALPYCLLRRANIRVDSLQRLLPTPVRAALDVLSLAVLSAFVLLLTYRAGLLFLETVDRNARSVSPLSTPLIIPQSIWLAGLAWYSSTIVISLLRLASALLRRDLDGVFEVAGSGATQSETDPQRVM